jgi:hypothetical protein
MRARRPKEKPRRGDDGASGQVRDKPAQSRYVHQRKKKAPPVGACRMSAGDVERLRRTGPRQCVALMSGTSCASSATHPEQSHWLAVEFEKTMKSRRHLTEEQAP